MQAIFYGLDGINLFDLASSERQDLWERVFAVTELAELLGCPVLVLGAPRMRNPHGMPFEEAADRITPLLEELAQLAEDHGTKFCIEPNPRAYGCGFVWTVKQAAELVEIVNHNGFGLHIDAAAMFMENEDGPETIRKFGALIEHYHVSEPNLRGLIDSQVNHRANLAALVGRGYDRWVSLETTDRAAFEPSVQALRSWSASC